MKSKFEIFENDGARFRMPAGRPARIVDDVWRNGRWEPYEGDRMKPAMFGDSLGIEEHEVEDRAGKRRAA